jgi:hypothetical protein
MEKSLIGNVEVRGQKLVRRTENLNEVSVDLLSSSGEIVGQLFYH